MNYTKKTTTKQDFKIEYVENSDYLNAFFYRDEFGDNCIYNNLALFYHDICYCEFSGLLLRLVEETECYYRMEILHNNFVDHLRHILDYRIDKYYNHAINLDTKYANEASKIWENVYEIDRVYNWDDKPGELVNCVVENDRQLLFDSRNGKELKPDYCYLFYDTITGKYKIGRSSNPKTRYKTLLSDRNSLEIKGIYETQCRQDSIILERKLHVYFKDNREIGEWFDLKHLTLEEILKCYENIAEEHNLEICDFDDNLIPLIDKFNG